MMSILRFELRLRSRQIATWLYALVFFLLAFLFVSTDVVQVGGGDGPVKATSPSTATMVVVVLAALGSVVSAALVGTAIQRDSDALVADLFATTGISRGAYYWGRFLGAWLVSIAVFCALPLGMVIGSAMPWVDPEVIAPFDPGTWGRIVLFFLVPNLLFTGALFFVFGTATRSLMAVYALGVGLFVLWAVSTGLASQLDNRIVSALSDPFGLGAMGADTRYWTVFEQNSRPIALSGMLLLNRLLWTGVAAALMFAGFAKFSFRADSRLAVGRRLGKNAIAPARDAPADDAPWTPVKSPLSGNRSQALWWSVFRSTVVSTHADMARALAYKVIVFAGLLLLGTNVWMADQVFDNETLLLTPVVLEQGFGSFGLFFIILVTVYSSEAVWRERSVRIDQIADALPVPSSALALGKYAAVGLLMARTTTLVAAGCVVLQLLKGSPSVDLGWVLSYTFCIQLPQALVLTAFAVWVHTVVDHRFIGHGVVLSVFVLQLALGSLGWDHELLQPFSIPNATLSDMNGYGPFVWKIAWYTVYWGAWSAFLLGLASLWWVRGRDTLLLRRIRQARPGIAGMAALSVAGIAVAGSGAWIVVNTNVFNRYQSSKQQLAERARYERTFRAIWREMPRPKVVKVDLDVDLEPSKGGYVSSGTLVLRNTSKDPIERVLVSTDPDATTVDLDWQGAATRGPRDSSLGTEIDDLKRPLAPGESTELRFRIARQRQGFPSGAPPLDVVANGSFLTMPVPSIGYQEDAEIADDSERRRQGLAKKPQMGDPLDPANRGSSYLGKDADWVEFACTVRTEPGQTAVAPGYLEKKWREGGKDCFRYAMDVPIRYFFTVVSAKYAVARDEWKAKDGRKVALEVYHHPAHHWNVNRMLAAMKDTLEWCEDAYTPFQYRQMRILEFPAYATFAQSFPNTVPFSEGIGFVLAKNDDPRAVDTASYVTAHEVAHQWWAHQVVGADAAGSEMLSESLADYTAVRIATRKVSPAGRRRVATQNLDRYLRGRSGDRIGENPLVRVQRQDYIHYSKGSPVLCAMAERVGEPNLNRAIASFAKLHAFGSAPYPTGEDFVAHLETVFPAQKAWIDSQFRRISLVDFRMNDVKKTKLPDGKWRVEARVTVESRESESGGREKWVGFDDRVRLWATGKSDSREYAGEVWKETRLPMRVGENRISLECDNEPFELLVDPLHEWIGTRPDDRKTGL